jgi:hypothetical protein
MSDTSTDIDALHQRIDDLEGTVDELRQQLRQAELDQWRGRIDDLEVQVHLGSMDLQDRLQPLLETLRNRWLDARAQMGDASTATSDVLDSLRGGVEQAVRDLRAGLVDARDAVNR